MGGFGGVNAMIQLLNSNNRKIRRNSQSYFKRKKNDYRPNSSKNNIKDKPQFSEIDLINFRKKLKKERQLNDIKLIILMVIITSGMFLLINYIFF